MRRIAVALGALALAGAAVPVTAFLIIPAFVRSSIYEPPPSSPPPGPSAAPAAGSPGAQAAGSPHPEPSPTRLRGDLRRVDAVHYGSGQVVLEAGNLRFENVDIAGAPNMFVYLSDRVDGSPGKYVDLGPLRATNGSFNYALPAGVDPAAARSVVVWCRAFSVTVTYAPLAPA